MKAKRASLTARKPHARQVFTLGRAGLPYYYRGRVRVPFEPIPGTIGVLLKQPAEQGKGRRKQQDALGETAKRFGGEVLRATKNFERSGLAVVRLDTSDDATVERRLAELMKDPGVEAVGMVVRLSEDHASFLTNLVIARFDDGVSEAAVAELAARHNLRPEGRFGDLGNVHRLRYKGLATYAVLNAANALAAEPGVVYAEPDLASTSEEDAIIPADFLFPEQWDHQLIATPDAWQALRDMDAARTFGNADVVVAVVDNGIDVTHPDLAGNVSSGNPKQVAMFDFANMVGNMSNLSTTAQQRDHGTACASAAVGNIGNASVVAGVTEGIAGIAGNCRLIGVLRGGTEGAVRRDVPVGGGLQCGQHDGRFPGAAGARRGCHHEQLRLQRGQPHLGAHERHLRPPHG